MEKQQGKSTNQSCNLKSLTNGGDTEVEEREDDLISNLPDEILCRIVSLLPFESAVQMNFLSRRWRNLRNMAFTQEGSEQDVSDALAHFLSNFNESEPLGNTRKLRFNFRRGGGLLATIGSHDKLHLSFTTAKRKCHRQFGWQLKLNAQPVTHKTIPAKFCVKTLYLVSVTSLTSEAISSMVSNLPLLESLKIAYCIGLQALRIDCNSKLLNLTIFDCPQLRDLRLKTPKIQSFRYRGVLPRFRNKYHFNLEDAMLDFRKGPGWSSFRSQDFDPMLLTVKNSRLLTLCGWTYEALIFPSISSLSAPFQFFKLKELWWIDNSKGRWNSDALISFLTLCPFMEKLFVTIDSTSYPSPSVDICTTGVAARRPMESLRMIKFEGSIEEADIVVFAERLKDEFGSEPLIIVPKEHGKGGCHKLPKGHLYEPANTSGGTNGPQECSVERSYCEVKEADMNVECLIHSHMGL